MYGRTHRCDRTHFFQFTLQFVQRLSVHVLGGHPIIAKPARAKNIDEEERTNMAKLGTCVDERHASQNGDVRHHKTRTKLDT